MFTKGQSGELAWVTSSNIPSPLKWFLGPFSDFASSLIVTTSLYYHDRAKTCKIIMCVVWRHHIWHHIHILGQCLLFEKTFFSTYTQFCFSKQAIGRPWPILLFVLDARLQILAVELNKFLDSFLRSPESPQRNGPLTEVGRSLDIEPAIDVLG